MILKNGPYLAKITAEGVEFHGLVINIRDTVDFYAKDMDGLRHEFAASIKVYEGFCKERGLEPNKPYSGKFALRFADPDLHRRADLAAAEQGLSLNAYINQLVERNAAS